MQSFLAKFNSIADSASPHVLIKRQTITLGDDEESQHSPIIPSVTHQASLHIGGASQPCAVCGLPIDYLAGVYQESGCTKHFGVAVAEVLGHNKNTLNHIHLENCYAKYRAGLLKGERYCALCLADAPEKPSTITTSEAYPDASPAHLIPPSPFTQVILNAHYASSM